MEAETRPGKHLTSKHNLTEVITDNALIFVLFEFKQKRK
jgi:hypothetical protein